jgi:hypothetical protein
LGHRQGSPVLASSRSHVYGFDGEPPDIHSYFRDLVLNTLVSNPAAAEIWTTPELACGNLKRVRVFDDARSLVSELEIEVIKRHRLFDEEDMDDWSAHQEAWPDDPLPLLLTLFPRCAEPLRNRLSAVAAQGQDLGILVLREDPVGGAVTVDGKTLTPKSTYMKELLGDGPFAAIAIAQSDRSEVLAALASASDPDEPAEMEPSQLAPRERARGDAGPPIKVRLFGAPEIVGVEEDQRDGFAQEPRAALLSPAASARGDPRACDGGPVAGNRCREGRG